MKLVKLKEYSPVVLRFAIGILFLYFGFSQLKAPTEWVGFLPPWVASLPISNTGFVVMNGCFEILFASLLLLGFFTRTSALLLGLHLLGIAATIGYNPLGVRDFILAITTLTIFLTGPDKICLTKKK